MKLILSGNDYKYEAEGVLKLFIPATLFEISYVDEDFVPYGIEGDFAFVGRSLRDEGLLCLVMCRVGEETSHDFSFLYPDMEDIENECELSLCRSLYECLSFLTGKTPEWGVITGVRPVKRINLLLRQGLDEGEIYKLMRERYLCSDKKTSIALKTAYAQEEILKTLKDDSFGLYVSVPFCPTRCSYCSFVSQAIEGCGKMIPEYVRQLCEEADFTADICKEAGIYPDSIYFGGGTPTTLSASQLEAVMGRLAGRFDLSRVREYTVEAGRPDTVTKEKLETIKKMGAGRVSINPQSLNDNVLRAIGRRHTTSQFFESFALAREIGFDVINTDIIAGLPEDTLESFKSTVDRLIELRAENITVHTLSIKRAARLNHGGEGALQSDAAEMVSYATERLLECGYRPYYLYRQKNMADNQENIGWALPGKESLYNIYIMEEVQTIIALGAGGSTKLVDAKTGRLERVFNYKYPTEYLAGFDEIIRRKQQIKEFYEKK